MRTSLTFGIFLALACLGVAQTKSSQVEAPKKALQTIVKLELDGTRLTPEGRELMARYLVRPEIVPPHLLNIISDKFEVDEVPSPQDRPRLNVYFSYFYGHVDSSLRFSASIHTQPGSGLLREGINQEYSLIRMSAQRNHGTSSTETKDSRQANGWRIESLPSYGFITLATAIRYVAERRERVTDPALKKNADKTLQELRKLK